MKFLKTIQNYQILILVVVTTLVCLLPYFIISIFNAPLFDDFANVALLNKVGYFDTIYAKLNNGGGRLFSYLIGCSIFFRSFLFVKILPPVILILLFLSTYFLISKSIFEHFKKFDKYIIAFVLFISFLNIMPSIAEGIYWKPGSIAYTIGLILINLFFAYYIQFKKTNNKKHFIIASLVLIAIIGTAEVNMIFIDAILASIFLYELILHRKINKYTFVLNSIGVVFSVLHILAPGNFKRADRIYNSKKGDIVGSIQNSIVSFFNYSLEWILINPVFIFSILIVAIIIIKNVNNNKLVFNSTKLPKINKISLAILCFGVLILTFLPTYFSLGHIGPLRNLNCICYFFIIIWAYVLWLSAPKLLELLGVTTQSFKNLNSKLILILLGIFSIALYFVDTNTKMVFNDLVTKKAYWYNEQIDWRINYLKQNKEKEIVLPPLVHAPKSLFIIDIYPKGGGKVNRSYRQYFKKNKLSIDSLFVPNDRYLNQQDDEITFKILENTKQQLILTGFAFSPNKSCDHFSNIYIKIGDNIIKGKYRLPLKWLKLDSDKPDCFRSAFRFKIPPKFLKKEKVLEFYLVDKFKVNKYKKTIDLSFVK